MPSHILAVVRRSVCHLYKTLGVYGKMKVDGESNTAAKDTHQSEGNPDVLLLQLR